jgi:CMP-N-acetylneuraminic acid synthetase
MLNGKPLIGYTIEAALGSGCFDKVLFSSDDEDLLKVAEEFGADPELRPAYLAADTSKVLELVNVLADREDLQKDFDIIALLLPTCPFRRASDLRAGMKLLDEGVDGVVSVTDYGFPPQLGVKVDTESGLLEGLFNPSPLVTGETRSQDQERILRPNGGFYMAWWNRFLENRNYFKGRVRPYIMERDYSTDVDTLWDFEFAEYLLKTGKLVLD